MKSNYKLKLFTAIVVLGVSLGNVNAFLPTLSQTTTHAENSDNWVQVQNNNGIKVFFSKLELKGKNYLNIKFENNTHENKLINWTLIGKNSDIIVKEFSTKVNANSFKEFYNPTMTVELSNGESLSNFSIIINHK